ncbi:hypothetical protein ACU8OH_21485 [Rhizobium leguminosarum]
MQLDLDAAIRTLLLPLRPGTKGDYSDRAADILDELGIAMDHADWVLLELKRWRDTASPSITFRRFVKELLFSPGRVPQSFAIDVAGKGLNASQIASDFAEGFFALHAQLMDLEKISHEEASRILSHTHTIALLASGSGMTASRIYGMLSKDGIVLGKGWSAVRTILDRCGLRQEIKQPEVEAIFNEDKEAEPELFGDLDIEGSIAHAASACREFGYRGDLAKQLRTLLIDVFHAPYICMVHFQLITLTIFHHKISNAYEFEPRGLGLLWLASRYRDSGLDVAGSPFLNNAKSVDTLDTFWAATKKNAQRPAARVVADLLHELDTLSDPSRSASGRYLRCLFHRLIRVSHEKNGPLPFPLPVFGGVQAANLCGGIGLGNTGTSGVLEQRLTDCWLLHTAGPLTDWHLKGFGDSVFATNTSKKKFGDAEIKHRNLPEIIAVEAHGGHLSQVYVDDHLATLMRVLPVRFEELEDRAPISDWTLKLRFVSHSVDAELLKVTEISGLLVKIEYYSFADIAPLGADAGFQALLQEHFVEQLNVVHVPAKFRQSALNLL